jgi:hypothetical protein
MMGNTNIANCSDSTIAKKAPYMSIANIYNIAGFADNTSTYTKGSYNAAILTYNHENNINKAVEDVENKIKAGKPVLIGVHYTNGPAPPNNKNRATRHFMVIVGMGIDSENNRYFRFYDPGKEVEQRMDAISPNNKLFFYAKQNKIQCNYNGETYTITEIIITN